MLVDYLLDAIKRAIGQDLREDECSRAQLLEIAREAKHALSTADRTTVRLEEIGLPEQGQYNIEIDVERKSVGKAWSAIADETIAFTESFLAQSQIKLSDVSDILLLGGLALSPLVKAKVTKFFGRDPITEFAELSRLGAEPRPGEDEPGPVNLVVGGAALCAHAIEVGEEREVSERLPMAIALGFPTAGFVPW